MEKEEINNIEIYNKEIDKKENNKKKKYIVIGGSVVFLVVLIIVIILIATSMMNQGKKQYGNWVDYLLEQDISSIKIKRFRSKDAGDQEDVDRVTSISIKDLKDILLEVEACEIHKVYTFAFGGAERDRLTVIYNIKDQTYQLEIYYNSIFIENADEKLQSLFESNDYFEENIGFKNIEGSFYFYNLMGFNDSVFDPYFD